jgi:hypothetical protein
MTSTIHTLCACLAVCVLAGAPASAQQDPDIGYVFPAGAQRGAEVVVTLGGQRLDGASAVIVTGEGVEASVIKHRPPLRGKALRKVRDKVGELRRERRELLRELRAQGKGKRKGKRNGKRKGKGKGKGKGKAGPQMMSPKGMLRSPELLEFAKELGIDEVDLQRFAVEQRKRRTPLGQVNAQLSESVTIRVKVAADAPLGARELRLMTRRGLTNPLVFHVGQYPEIEEVEPGAGAAAQEVSALPALVNGQILPGDVDRFRFRVTKGTRLVAAVAARSLIPYLADAVPGWFQATLSLFDARGQRVAYNDDFRCHPDPVLFYEVPADGEYVLEIKDAIYRGREDFVYRISLGALPYATSAFPLGAQAGFDAQVAVTGVNLGGLSLRVPGREQPGRVSIGLRTPRGQTNALPFAVGSLPEELARERQGHSEAPQQIQLPLWLNGRIERAGDWDVFRFQGKRGEVVVAEVQARRLGSPLDSLLMLTDARGRFLAANDDHEDQGAGLVTHQADSWLSFRLPRDGTYLLRLGDTQGKGGVAYGYRLRVGPPQPNFELRVVPATINARPGASMAIRVHALRRDGFAGPISLALEGAPSGFSLGGGRIPAGQDELRLTLSVPPRPLDKPVALRLVGSAQIEGGLRRSVAVPAEDQMQAFLYRHLVPVEQWLVAVKGRRGASAPRLVDRAPLALSPGSERWVRFELGRRPRMLERIGLALSEGPRGIELVRFKAEESGVALLLRVAADVEAKLEGNLIVQVFLSWTPKAREGQKKKPKAKRVPIGVLPALPFHVTPHRGTPLENRP